MCRRGGGGGRAGLEKRRRGNLGEKIQKNEVNDYQVTQKKKTGAGWSERGQPEGKHKTMRSLIIAKGIRWDGGLVYSRS